MRFEPANIVCPACGSGNYMRHLRGKNVGYLDMKCINCNSYFNFDELYKRRIGEALKPKSQTNGDLVRQMSDEGLARYYARRISRCYGCEAVTEDDCFECQMEWLKAPVEVDE